MPIDFSDSPWRCGIPLADFLQVPLETQGSLLNDVSDLFIPLFDLDFIWVVHPHFNYWKRLLPSVLIELRRAILSASRIWTLASRNQFHLAINNLPDTGCIATIQALINNQCSIESYGKTTHISEEWVCQGPRESILVGQMPCFLDIFICGNQVSYRFANDNFGRE